MRGQVNANPNVKRYPCPECTTSGITDKTFTKSGLRGHRLFVHNIAQPKKTKQTTNLSTSAATPITPPIPTLPTAPATTDDKKSEVNTMAEEHKHDDNCPECKKRTQTILNLESEVKSAKESIAKLEAQVAAAPETVAEIPSDLQLVIDHCESGECVDHKKQWDSIKARIVKGALDNIPDNIIETEGLKRGIIPQKIVIRG